MTKIAAPNPLGECHNIATRALCQRIKPAFSIVRHDDDFASTTAIFRRPAGTFPFIDLPSGTLKHRPAIDAFPQFNQLGILRHDPSA
jgi:hypothetical protein